MNIDEMIEVLQAYKDGKRVQTRQIDSSRVWVDNESPLFSFGSFDYRVKPEPREFWLCKDKDTRFNVFDSPPLQGWDEIIKVREVIE